MKRFLLLMWVLSSLLSCGAAFADFAYTTEDGTLGYISVESSESIILTPGVASGLGSAPLAAAWNKGEGKVAVINDGTVWDEARIYTSGNWTEPDEVTLTGVSGTSGVSVSNNGKSVFVASENTGHIVEFTLDSYELTGRSFDCAAAYGGSPLAEDVAVHGNVIYGLLSLSSQNGKSKLVALDGFLKVRTMYASFDVGAGATCIADASDGRVGIGRSGGLDVLAKNKITSVFSGADVTAVQGDSDGGLYFMARKSSGGTASNTLYLYKSSEAKELSFTGTGAADLSWDNSTKLLAMMTSDRIQIIDKEGTLVKSYTASELGGAPVSVAYMPRSSNRSDGSRDSGCGVMPGGLLLLPLAPVAARLMRRRG